MKDDELFSDVESLPSMELIGCRLVECITLGTDCVLTPTDCRAIMSFLESAADYEKMLEMEIEQLRAINEGR